MGTLPYQIRHTAAADRGDDTSVLDIEPNCNQAATTHMGTALFP